MRIMIENEIHEISLVKLDGKYIEFETSCNNYIVNFGDSQEAYREFNNLMINGYVDLFPYKYDLQVTTKY